MLFFRIIKILHVLWLSLIRHPIVETSSSGVQFVEQGHSIAGEKPEVLFFLQTGEYWQQWREQDCFIG